MCDNSNHDQPYIIVNMPVNKFETRIQIHKELENFELEKYVGDFKALLISLVYSCDTPVN